MSPYMGGMDEPRNFAAIKSTSDLIPAGVQGYAKTIAAFVAGLITVVVPFLPINSDAAHYAQIAVAVAGFITVFAVPNKVAAAGNAAVDHAFDQFASAVSQPAPAAVVADPTEV